MLAYSRLILGKAYVYEINQLETTKMDTQFLLEEVFLSVWAMIHTNPHQPGLTTTLYFCLPVVNQ